MNKPADIDAYLSTLPEDSRETLAGLRRTIKALVPEAAESVSYGVPTFKYQGRPLIYIGAAKNHCALYGVNLDLFPDELSAYDTSKGTVRFPAGQPPPEALVKKLLNARIAEIESAAATRKRKK
jgi:uncharacterized protein YdhG (YjbR/CyaY superfamily)